MSDYEAVRLNSGMERRVRAGHPWVYANEIRMMPSYRVWPKGEPVRLEAADGGRLGLFMFNAHSLIAARLPR